MEWFKAGYHADALAAYRKSLDLHEALVAYDSAITQWQRDLSIIHHGICKVQIEQGDDEGALESMSKSISITASLLGIDITNIQ